jgi:copper resistance protein D
VSLRLVVLWVHLVAAVVWIGGLAYQTHVLLPAARRSDPRAFAEASRRARPVTWTAIALVVLSGFYNVTQLGPLERVMQSGAGLLLAAKFGLVIVAVALAGQRDFAQVSILDAAIRGGGDPGRVLASVARLDRVVLLLALIIIYLGLAASRA